METFCNEYARQLAIAVREHPGEYGYDAGKVPGVVAKMRPAIAAGTFSKDSRAVRAACKALHVKHTYQAIAAFIKANP